MTSDVVAPPKKRSDLAIRTVTGVALILVAVACLVYRAGAVLDAVLPSPCWS